MKASDLLDFDKMAAIEEELDIYKPFKGMGLRGDGKPARNDYSGASDDTDPNTFMNR